MESEPVFKVRFWGTRGSIATPGPGTCRYGGNTSCVEVQVGEHTFICDAGTGLRLLGLDWARRSSPPHLLHLILSHTHFDHVQGFPFFLPVYRPGVIIRLLDPTGQASLMRDRLFGLLTPEYSPVSLHNMAATIQSVPINGHWEISPGLWVECWQQSHPGLSYGYAFAARGKRVVYATDSELDAQLGNANPASLTASHTRVFPAEVLQRYQDADIAIADSQYSDEEYSSRAGWGHARLNTVVDLAIQAHVRHLVLYHHDPQHNDDTVDQMVLSARQRASNHSQHLQISAAAEGLIIEL